MGKFISRLIERVLSLIFENPITNAYARLAGRFAAMAEPYAKWWISAAVLAMACYYADLGFAIKNFDGSWASPEFLTKRTVIPWAVYVFICAMIVPLTGFLLLSRSRRPTLVGEDRRLTNAASTVITIALAVFVWMPYAVITVASGSDRFVDNCPPQIKSECESVNQGAVPASGFHALSPDVLLVKTNACITFCRIDTPRMRTVQESVIKLKEVVDRIKRDSK